MNQKDPYQELLESKIQVAPKRGITISETELHYSTKPHQRDIILWALELGAGLIAADTGMGKSHIGIEVMRIVQKYFGGKCLIVTELGAAETFINPDPEVGEGARLGVILEYVTSQLAAFESKSDIVVTNYERVRDGKFDFSGFSGVWLDEGNYLKNMASETTGMLRRQLAKVNFKYVATATPSPNETLELINYADALGITDRGQILTRYFQRNSVKAGELTLHPQHTDDFWMWVYSWAVFIQRPSDLGYDDEGYDLPQLNVRWVEVKLTKQLDGKINRDGQKEMFVQSSASLPEAAKLKRASIGDRLQAAAQVMVDNPGNDHWIIWHHLEDERRAINDLFKKHPSYGDVFGALHWKEKERRIVAFSKGELEILATKPEISGVGCNFQKHCYNNIVLGVTDSFDEFYQLLKRTHRYPQKQEVNAWVFYCSEEYSTVQNLQRKWKEHDESRAKMREIVLKYGLNQSKFIEARKRTFMVERNIYRGENYELINTDAVYEWKQRPSNSVDMFLSSFPFGNHYEYTDKINDFGHNATNKDFLNQLGHLLPEMLRCLKPGRICAVHLKNRIHYGSVTGIGFSIMHRFTHLVCDAMEAAGFYTMGFHYVPTDVVAENNQTYRLGFGEMKKDATKMGAGIPEEIWIFRKAPTSNENAYADEPVKVEEGYSLSNWQLDADAMWKSSGNRLLTPQELKTFGIDRLRKWWDKFNSEITYDYDEHVKLLDAIDQAGKLSKTFTTLPLRSNTDFVWNDVNRMHGLNMEQSRRKLQNHICPMPFDEVDRLIKLYSMPGETIADPFGGVCTTGVRSIKWGRKAIITELNDTYAKCGNVYMREQEQKANVPTLFDMIQ